MHFIDDYLKNHLKLKSNSTYCKFIFTWINSIGVRRVTRRQNRDISNNNIAAKKEEILVTIYNKRVPMSDTRQCPTLHDIYDYIELQHFLKLLSMSTYQYLCRVGVCASYVTF
jgi:hypothetical protein